MSATAMEEDGPGSFDLEGYIAGYTGHTKIDRLLFVAERSRNQPVELEALKIAHDDLKKTNNTAKYMEVIQKIDGRLGNEYCLDSKWVDTVERRCASRQERLEQDLNGFKTNLVKESIRLGHNELGDFFYERGDLQSAFKCLVRSRDYCTTSKQIISMCLNVVRVAIEMANWMHVQNYVTKAEQTPDVTNDPVVMAKLKASMGLAFLHTKKYKQAARHLVETKAELGSSYSDVMAPQDVAIYGGLCALATFDRSELQSSVISNIAFKEFLELVPELRDLIRDFHNSRYASCLRALDALQPSLRLDMHLAEHVSTLYSQIRQRAVMQYVAPFITVDLSTMATAFNSTVGALEKEVAGLIMDGKVQARIDSHRKVLHASHADARGQTYQQVLAAGESYLRETKAMLLRASLIHHDFVQRPKGPGWGGRGGAEGGLRLGPRGDMSERMGFAAEQRGIRAMLREGV